MSVEAQVEAIYEWPGYPHGLALSPDESTMYVTRTHPSGLDAFEVYPDGSLHRRRQLVASTMLDVAQGLSVAPSGILFIACGTSLGAYEPSTGALASLEIPGTAPGSRQGGAFGPLHGVAYSSRSPYSGGGGGGGGGGTLYLTGAGGVWALPLGSGPRFDRESTQPPDVVANVLVLCLLIAAIQSMRRWRLARRADDGFDEDNPFNLRNGMARRLRWRASR
jgi:hypothetical protein